MDCIALESIDSIGRVCAILGPFGAVDGSAKLVGHVLSRAKSLDGLGELWL